MLNIITNAEAKESLELVEVIELNKEELMERWLTSIKH